VAAAASDGRHLRDDALIVGPRRNAGIPLATGRGTARNREHVHNRKEVAMGLEEFLEYIGADADGWEADGDDILVCPCGNRIELDGHCPEGCKSPLLTRGFI
jgi:hypothetical protein